MLAVLLICSSNTSALSTEGVLRHVARTRGVPRASLEITGQTSQALPLTGHTLRLAKVMDRTTGRVYVIATDTVGRIVDAEALQAAERQAYAERYGKLSPQLYEQMQQADRGETIPVLIWLDDQGKVPVPQRPLPGKTAAIDTAKSEAIQSRHREQMSEAITQIQTPVRNRITALGGHVSYASRYAPLIAAEISPMAIRALEDHSGVVAIDLADSSGERKQMDSAAQTVRADRVWDQGYTGSAAQTVAILEGYNIDTDNPYLSVIARRSGSLDDPDEHKTQVAGVVASQHTTYRGIAPDVGLLDASYDPALGYTETIAAADWAISNGAQVINASIGTKTDGEMYVMDRYFDYIARHSYVTIVAAAGNTSTCDPEGYVTGYGLGYNILTVGSFDDADTADWDDDTMSSFSCYKDPASPHSDREKPEVAAVGEAITTTCSPFWTGADICPLSDPGTSFAAPAVAGQAALLMQRNSYLTDWPEAIRAIIMASAINNIEGNSRLSEYDGAGGVDVYMADTVVKNNWWAVDNLTESSFDGNNYDISAYFEAGEHVRVVIAWDSSPSSDYASDPLDADLDLYVFHPNGSPVSGADSDTWDNSYEIVEFEATYTGDHTIRVYKSRFDGSLEYLGVAWARVAPPEISGLEVSSTKPGFYYDPGLDSDGGTVYLNTASGEGGGQTLTVETDWSAGAPQHSFDGTTAFGDDPLDTSGGDGWEVAYSVESWSATEANVLFVVTDGLDRTDTAYITFQVDNVDPTAPTISSATHPDEDAWYTSDDVTFSWSTPTDASGIAGYYYSLDHSQYALPTTYYIQGNSRAYSDLDDGTWYFHVRAQDRVGNRGDADHYRVKIDDTPPGAPAISSSTHPVEGTCYPHNDPIFYWSPPSDVSGIAAYSYVRDQSPSTVPDTVSEGDATAIQYFDLPNGDHYFHVRALDNAGHWGATSHYHICVSVNTAPSIGGLPDRTTPEDTPWNNSIDLWAYASDAEDGDADLAFTVDNAPNPSAGASIDSNRYVDIEPAGDWCGSTTVRIRATDPGGLWDTDEFDVNVTCVNDAPVLDWTGETYYTTDGLHPEVGTPSMSFAYRIKYSDVDGNAPGYTRVHIEKGGSPISGSPFNMTCASGDYTAGVICTYTKSGLATGTDYTYTFTAQDTGGAGATPTTELDAPDVNPSPPPAAPDDLAASAFSQTAIDLTWDDNSSDETSFSIYQWKEGTPDWEFAGSVGANATSVRVQGLSCDTRYYFRIRAYRSGDGQFSDYSNTDYAWTLLCDLQVPSGLVANAVSQTQIDLAWQDNSDDETHFVVERSPDGSSWSDVETVPADTESYSNTGLSCGTSYHYRIRAFRSADSATAQSNVASDTTYACPPTNHAPTLAWTSETNYTVDGLHPESGDAATTFTYRIKYADQDGHAPAYVRVHIKKGGAEISGSPFMVSYVSGSYASGAIYTFGKSGLAAGSDYTYHFEAQDIYGAGATPSTSKDAPDVSATNTAPTLAWTGETNYTADGLHPESGDTFTTLTYRVKYTDADGDAPNYVRVHIEKGGSPISGSPFAMTKVSGSYAGGAIYSLDRSELGAGTDYTYIFEAQDSQGASATPTTEQNAPDVSSAPPPTAPSGLTAQAVSQSRINLAWQDNSGDETGFRVERSPDGSTGWTQIGTTSANVTSYSDDGLSCNTPYYYRVRAYRASDGQDSGYSNAAGDTTAACASNPEIVFSSDVVTATVHRGIMITIPLTVFNDGDAPLTYTLRARRIALIADDPYGDESAFQELGAITPTLQTMGLAFDEFYDNWDGSNPVYTNDPDFLAGYTTVVWHADPTPTTYRSRLITQDEHDALEDHLQQGWSLMVTGEDVIDNAAYSGDDIRLMQLTRVFTGTGGYPDGQQYQVINAWHQVHRGPYWTFSEGEQRWVNYSYENLHADSNQGAIALLEWLNIGQSDLLISTQISTGGKVLLWNGDCRWPWPHWDYLKPFFENALFWTEAPWLGYTPGTVTVPAGSSENLTLSLDASPRTWVSQGLPEGDYSTVLVFETNDPAQPWVQVPVTMTVIPNTPPAITNISASQRPGTGLVDIAYDLEDGQQDTVGVTFQYWDGSAWAAPTTITGGGSIVTGTERTALWDAKTDFDGHYLKSARIRITATDGQTTNQTGYGEGVEFELDTQIPTNNGLHSPAYGTIDVVISPTLTAQAASGDVPPLQYRFLLDDNAAFDDGSGCRQDSGWLTNDLDWTPTTLITNTAYWWKVQVRDAYSNTASFSAPYSFTTQSAAGNHTPVLAYTGEENYATDGLHPEVGSPWTSFVFRVVYADQDGDLPTYVRARVKKGSVEANGSPFALSYVSGNHTTGAVYAATITGMEPGFDYTYLFEASDINAAITQMDESLGPDVSGGSPSVEEFFEESGPVYPKIGGYGAHIGNIFQVMTPTHISEFALYYGDSTSQWTSWFIAESDAFPGEFTIIFSKVEWTLGAYGEWRSSGEIDINLEPGKLYFLGVGFTSSYATIWQYRSQALGSEMPLDISFGQLLQGYHGTNRGDWDWWPPAGTNTLDAVCAPEEVCGPYYMRIYTGYPSDIRQVYLPLVVHASPVQGDALNIPNHAADGDKKQYAAPAVGKLGPGAIAILYQLLDETPCSESLPWERQKAQSLETQLVLLAVATIGSGAAWPGKRPPNPG
jgi:hypothetical protein